MLVLRKSCTDMYLFAYYVRESLSGFIAKLTEASRPAPRPAAQQDPVQPAPLSEPPILSGSGPRGADRQPTPVGRRGATP